MRVVAWRVARLALLGAVLGVSDEHSYSYDRHADPAYEEVEDYFSDGRAEGYFSVTFLNRMPRTTLKLSRVQSRGAARVVPPSSEEALAPNGTLSFTDLFGHELWAKFYFSEDGGDGSTMVLVQASHEGDAQITSSVTFLEEGGDGKTEFSHNSSVAQAVDAAGSAASVAELVITATQSAYSYSYG